MSELTLQLFGKKPAVASRSVWQKRFGEIADRLVAAYGLPSLGNFRDPVREIFYIVLSAKTTDAQYRRTHRRLMKGFPTLSALALAPVREIVRCIVGGGLANKKARQVRAIAKRLSDDLGQRPGTRLRRMSAKESYDYLTALPGLGPKSALCVMMWSLDFDVFPVDANVSRIAIRLGVVPPALKHYNYTEVLPAIAPEGRSRELHVGLLVHGRTVCLPRKPRCKACILVDLCSYGKRRLRDSSNDRGTKKTKQT